jgi:hypothetical protein
MNKNTVQRIFQLKGWQVRKRAVGSRPRIEAKVSAAERPDERWSTDLCRVWGGQDGWLVLALVIDCHTRQLLGWHLARTGKATTAGAALEQALISRYGCLGRVHTPFLLRSDNGLVFTSRHYTRLVRSYGLNQEFITPHCPQQSGFRAGRLTTPSRRAGRRTCARPGPGQRSRPRAPTAGCGRAGQGRAGRTGGRSRRFRSWWAASSWETSWR